MLACSFLIKSSSKLLVTRTGIKAWLSLILCQIRPLILELLALEWRKFCTFELEYLWSQWASLDQISWVASLGWGKGCIRFWGRLTLAHWTRWVIVALWATCFIIISGLDRSSLCLVSDFINSSFIQFIHPPSHSLCTHSFVCWSVQMSEHPSIHPSWHLFIHSFPADGSTGFKAEAGRYHIYVSLACPWAHRTLIVRKMKGLEDVISVMVVDWFLTEKGWSFTDQVSIWWLTGF